MFLPLGDDNPRRSIPFVTIVIIAANAAVFLANNLGADEATLREFFLVWGYDAQRPVSLQVVSSMFMHGGWLHILGNMWVLWIVGDNVEDKLGRFMYLILYLLGGAVAVWAYSGIAAATGPTPGAMAMFGRPHPPLVGASGAVYAVMGMYLVLFPEARIRLLMWIFVFVQVIRMPAKLFIGLTIALDFLRTVVAGGPASSGVATAAHVGGGLFGIAVAAALKKSVGGGASGDAWDVHTGFSKTTNAGTEPARGPAAALLRRDGEPDDDPWHARPEPMEDHSEEVEQALIELVRAGRFRDAIDVYPAYAAMRREKPLPADVQIEIAHEFYRQGLARDGISAYRRFLDTYPADPAAPEAAFRIGILYSRGLSDPAAAAPWLDRAARTHPNPQAAQYAAAELRRVSG